jgi:DNA-directed RNA polymerase specialized sigma subunit
MLSKKDLVKHNVKWPIINADLRQEILLSKANGQLSDRGALMLCLMVEKIISKFHYDRIEDEEDCMSSGIEGALTKWHKYEPKYDNAFSFFTQMIKNDIYAMWNKMNKRRADVSISNVFTESA